MANNPNNMQLGKTEQDIKSAVSSQSVPMTSEQSDMEVSMTQQPPSQDPGYYQNPYQGQQEQQQDYSAGYQDPNQQYPQQQYSSMSSDTVSEIAEEVVAEKFFNIKKELEKVIEFRTSVQAKMEYLDERLKRIEKIIDRLQLSVLQKVGDYMTNVEDIKKELDEVQKTFKSVSDSRAPRKQEVPKEQFSSKTK